MQKRLYFLECLCKSQWRGRRRSSLLSPLFITLIAFANSARRIVSRGLFSRVCFINQSALRITRKNLSKFVSSSTSSNTNLYQVKYDDWSPISLCKILKMQPGCLKAGVFRWHFNTDKDKSVQKTKKKQSRKETDKNNKDHTYYIRFDVQAWGLLRPEQRNRTPILNYRTYSAGITILRILENNLLCLNIISNPAFLVHATFQVPGGQDGSVWPN